MIGQLVHDVRRGTIDERVRGVEAKAVEPVFLDPVPHVFAHEVPHVAGARPVQIESLPPIRLVFGEIELAELADHVARGSEMVVDDVENHRKPQRVRRIHERARIVPIPAELTLQD